MKLFLCVAIAAICTYIGRLFAKRAAQRSAYLISFQTGLSQITDKIVGLNMPLYNALTTGFNSEIEQLFKICAKSLKESPSQSFEKLWQREFKNKCQSFLTKEDVSIILEAGQAIEMLCKNPGRQQAELYKNRLSKYVDAVEKDKQKKIKLFTTSGVLAGLLLALLII